MAGVELQFLPPLEEDIVTLHVEEAPTQGGVYAEIQQFPAGTEPNYITSAEVTDAVTPTDWFRIRWQNGSGNFTPYSSPIQGGTTTIVAQVMDRVILRDPGVNPIIAGQEAEAVIAWYYGVTDPYSVDPSQASPIILSGLTTLTLARVYISRLITQSLTPKWQAGLISMDASSASSAAWKNIDNMIDMANRELGRNVSTIMVLEEISVAGGFKQLKSFDVSRALIELA
jgi:hypothetical protein